MCPNCYSMFPHEIDGGGRPSRPAADVTVWFSHTYYFQWKEAPLPLALALPVAVAVAVPVSGSGFVDSLIQLKFQFGVSGTEAATERPRAACQ